MNKMTVESGETKAGLVPKLRFPEFRDAPGWEEKVLSDVAAIAMGSSPKSENYNQEQMGLPLLQGNADIKDRLSAPRIYTSEITKECSIGDILFSVRAPVGTVAKSIHHACIGRGIAAITSQQPNSLEFLYQWLLSYESQWGRVSQGGTFDAVNSDDLRGIVLSVPKPPEQQKIAECLGSLDELIGAEREKLEALKAYKKGLMQQLFPREGETVPRLRFPEFRGSGGWEQSTLGNEASILKGKGISKADIHADGNQPCIRYGELYTRYSEIIDAVFSRTKVAQAELFLSKANDVIIPSSGETKIDIATASCVLHDNIALGGDLNVIRSNLHGPFLSYYLNGPKRYSIARVAQGDTVVHLYPYQLEKIGIAFPQPAEQKKIGAFLCALDKQIGVGRIGLEMLSAQKKALMQQLFPSPLETQT